VCFACIEGEDMTRWGQAPQDADQEAVPPVADVVPAENPAPEWTGWN
jgi:hypothetical protein